MFSVINSSCNLCEDDVAFDAINFGRVEHHLITFHGVINHKSLFYSLTFLTDKELCFVGQCIKGFFDTFPYNKAKVSCNFCDTKVSLDAEVGGKMR